jgi:GMP synthase-like glutamine amidotransferase
MSGQNGFLILDFGSQVTQLIARRLREMGYYSEIKHFAFPTEEIKKAIAKAGHDVEGEKAPDSAYKKLPDCCQYRDKACEKK